MMKLFQKLKKDQHKIRVKNSRWINGFTLIEMLVAIACFVFVMMAVVEIFVIGLGGGQRALGFQNVQDATRFMMELAAKEIRMSEIQEVTDSEDTVYTVKSLAGGFFYGPYKAIRITNSKGIILQYSFDSNQFKRSGTSLNPGNVLVKAGRFYLRKQGADAGAFPPSVIISFSAINQTGKAAQQVQLDLETTISSRRYDLAK